MISSRYQPTTKGQARNDSERADAKSLSNQNTIYLGHESSRAFPLERSALQ